jgi:hypothetical protein
MNLRTPLAVSCLLSPVLARSQQASVHLDFNPQKNTEHLVGGSGELPSNWIYDGRANFIMDNLIAEKKAVPMVIAIPSHRVVHRNHPQHARHDWATRRNLLYHRFLPNLWRKN